VVLELAGTRACNILVELIRKVEIVGDAEGKVKFCFFGFFRRVGPKRFGVPL